jgi:hypothetical protein
MMNEVKSETLNTSTSDVKRSSPDPFDRFERRLTKYRVHQSDCEMKNDESFRSMCAQESDHIRKLQEQQTSVGKQKRKNQKQPRKRKVWWLTVSPRSHLKSYFQADPVPSQPIPADVQNDLADLNYSEMLSLLSGDYSRLSHPFVPQQPPVWCYLPEVYENQPNLNQTF